MISANDVRVGNSILCDGNTVEIVTIEYDYFVCRSDAGTLIICTHDNAKPVLITNEIFKFWGFIRKDLWWMKGTFTFYDSNALSSSSFMFTQHIRCTKVKYLHQLQNLYYSIEGVELEREVLEMEKISA